VKHRAFCVQIEQERADRLVAAAKANRRKLTAEVALALERHRATTPPAAGADPSCPS
jgi:hypothetical protein